MQQKIFKRMKLFEALLALRSYHLLLKITKYVNWSKKFHFQTHILYCEVSFHLFLIAFNSEKIRYGKFSQHFPNIKKNYADLLWIKGPGLKTAPKKPHLRVSKLPLF